MKFISIPVFIVSLAVGLFFVYVYTPGPKVIYIYPTPDNVDDIQYKDKSGSCHKYQAKNVECPVDEKKITETPVQ
tara:strand:- start:522 stop:746 length:225 start_codon:yes stop_codon:yes gene_type:complete